LRNQGIEKSMKSRNREIGISGYREIEKSRNREIEKSRHPEIEKSINQEIGMIHAAMWHGHVGRYGTTTGEGLQSECLGPRAFAASQLERLREGRHPLTGDIPT
jgi:hypothetical protein